MEDWMFVSFEGRDRFRKVIRCTGNCPIGRGCVRCDRLRTRRGNAHEARKPKITPMHKEPDDQRRS